jgi:hypothetical protein
MHFVFVTTIVATRFVRAVAYRDETPQAGEVMGSYGKRKKGDAKAEGKKWQHDRGAATRHVCLICGSRTERAQRVPSTSL